MSRFVAIGECMVELSPTGTDGLWQQGFAGDTLNTAWYARASLPEAWHVDYVTRLGTDHFSDGILSFLSKNGLGISHVTRDENRGPGLYAIYLKDGERSFTYWRGESAARGLADDPVALDRALDGASLVFVSGITAAILPPSARLVLQKALVAARKQGAQIAFDPNIRPRLWENMDSAQYWIGRFAESATIALPSFDDERAAFGDQSPEETVSRYRRAGSEEVVVKNGGHEIAWCHLDQAGSVRDLSMAQPVDTTGAGDSFNGAYLSARLQGEAVPLAIAAGHAMASRVVMQRGALIAQASLRKPDSQIR